MGNSMFLRSQVALNKTRSVFTNNYKHLTSMNYGRVYPIDIEFVMPGTGVKKDVTSIIRGATPLYPVMGDSKLEIMSFYVPYRIIWNKMKQFMGENDTSAWTNSVNELIPQVKLKIAGIGKNQTGADDYIFGRASDNADYSVSFPNTSLMLPNKLADYLGVNIGIQAQGLKSLYDANKSHADIKVSAMPFRAYWAVLNDFFRDENWQAPILFSKDSTEQDPCNVALPYSLTSYNPTQQTNTIGLMNGSDVAYACKKQDSFTTVLPQCMKGPNISLLDLAGLAPVEFGDRHSLPNYTIGMQFKNSSGGILGATSGNERILSINASGKSQARSNQTADSGSVTAEIDNAWANLANAGAITLDTMRIWIATGHIYEKLAVGGSRYNETIYTLYGVRTKDSTIQRAEFLGGKSIVLTQYQVTQNSPKTSTSDTSLGDVGAFSYTADNTNTLFYKECDEFGIILTVAVARIERIYPNTIDAHYYQREFLDMFFPDLDSIGQQGIPYKVMNPLCAATDGTNYIHSSQAEATFGFQEAWWFERFKDSHSSGILNASNPHSLKYMTYSQEAFDPYTNPGSTYLLALEDELIVERTLQLGAQATGYAQQLICNFEFNEVLKKPMHVRSIPGQMRI